MTLTELAEAVNVDPADVRVVLAWHEHDADDIPHDVATAVRIYLDGRGCERTVPELYWPGLPAGWREDD